MNEINFSVVRKSIIERIVAFEKSLPEEYEVVASVSGLEMVLESVGEVQDFFFEFKGVSLDHFAPIQIYIKCSDLLLTLSAQPLPVNQVPKRRPIFFG